MILRRLQVLCRLDHDFYLFFGFLIFHFFIILFSLFFIFPPFSSYDFERDIARIIKEQEFVTKRMKEFEDGFASSQSPKKPEAKVGFAAIQEMARLQEAEDQGDLLKGIVIWFIRREGIEPIKRVPSLFSNTLFIT